MFLNDLRKLVSGVALLLLKIGAFVSVVYAVEVPRGAVIGSGGTVGAQSANRRVSGVLGQTASSRASSPSHQAAQGFWNTVALCDCPHIGDLDTNGVLSVSDVVALVNAAFRGGAIPPGDPLCPLFSRGDLTCDGVISVMDVVTILNATFRNNDTRCNPCLQ
jgi:hypothetical protein